MAATVLSRHHRQLFVAELARATGKAELAHAAAAHGKYLTPADHAEARAALARRAAELFAHQPGDPTQ